MDSRRNFLKAALGMSVAPGLLAWGQGDGSGQRGRRRTIASTGSRIESIETFTRGPVSIVRVRTDSGQEGYGQISTYDVDISATILHRRIAGHALGKDPADLDAISDRCIEANYKYPWSFVCRALTGLDTALWDIHGKTAGKSVCELLGGRPRPFPACGSSMRRDIKPADEAERLVRLRDELGYRAFKIRIGKVCGHDQDQWPGRTEELVPTVRKAIGDDIALLVDANSCYTLPNARLVSARSNGKTNRVKSRANPITGTSKRVKCLSMERSHEEADDVCPTRFVPRRMYAHLGRERP